MTEKVEFKTDFSEAAALIFVLVLTVLCYGEPDILDGLIKRANQVECSK